MGNYFQNLSKKKQIGLILIILFLLGGLFLLSKNVFFADTGPFGISGRIYGQDTKLALADVNIVLSSENENEDPVTTKTDVSGSYSISVPSGSYKYISITKENYWDLEGKIINPAVSSINLNLDLKPGFGKEDLEIVTAKKSLYPQKKYFGLSLQPFDDSVSSLVNIVPNGESYKEEKITDKIAKYNPEKNDFTEANNDLNKVSTLGNLPFEIKNSATVYSPDNDKYYLFGGEINGQKTNKIYEWDRNDPQNLTEVAQLSTPVASGNAIYIEEYKVVLIVADGRFWFFRPSDYKVASLGRQTLFFGIKTILDGGDKLYLMIEDELTPDKIYIRTLTKNSLVGTQKVEDCFQEGTACDLKIDSSVLTINSLSSPTPYFNPNDKKIYLFGGKQNGNPTDKIFSIDPKNISDPNNPATELSERLPLNIDSPAYFSNETTLDLFGGNTKIEVNFKDGLKVLDPVTPFSTYNTSSQTFVQDNSDRLFVFSKPIVKIANSVILNNANAYYATPLQKDLVLVFRGRTKQDNFTIETKPTTNNIFFANPFGNSIAFNDITITNADKQYSLKEAADAGVIANEVWTSDYTKDSSSYKQKQVDLNDLEQDFQFGGFVALKPLKDLKIDVGLQDQSSPNTVSLDNLTLNGRKVTINDINNLLDADAENLNSSQTELQNEIDEQNNNLLEKYPYTDIIQNTFNGKIVGQPNPSEYQYDDELFSLPYIEEDGTTAQLPEKNTGLVNKAKAGDNFCDHLYANPEKYKNRTQDDTFFFDSSWDKYPEQRNLLKSKLPEIYQNAKLDYLPCKGTFHFPRKSKKITISVRSLDLEGGALANYDSLENRISFNMKLMGMITDDNSQTGYNSLIDTLTHETIHALRNIYTVPYKFGKINFYPVFEESMADAVAWKAAPNKNTSSDCKNNFCNEYNQYTIKTTGGDDLVGVGSAVQNEFYQRDIRNNIVFEDLFTELEKDGTRSYSDYKYGAYFWLQRMNGDKYYFRKYNYEYMDILKHIFSNPISPYGSQYNSFYNNAIKIESSKGNIHPGYSFVQDFKNAYGENFVTMYYDSRFKGVKSDLKYNLNSGNKIIDREGNLYKNKEITQIIYNYYSLEPIGAITDMLHDRIHQDNTTFTVSAYKRMGKTNSNGVIERTLLNFDDIKGISDKSGVSNYETGSLIYRTRGKTKYILNTDKGKEYKFYYNVEEPLTEDVLSAPDHIGIFGVVEQDNGGEVTIENRQGEVLEKVPVKYGYFEGSNKTYDGGYYWLTYKDKSGEEYKEMVNKTFGSYMTLISNTPSHCKTSLSSNSLFGINKAFACYDASSADVSVETGSNNVMVNIKVPEPSSAHIDYGTDQNDLNLSRDFYDEAEDFGVALTDLQSFTKYYYKVTLYDENAKETVLDVKDFVTGGSIKDITVTDITQTSAKVVYELDLGGASGHTAFVRYGETTEYGQIAGDSFGGAQSPYNVSLSNLQAGHLYHYQLGIYPSPTGIEPDFSKVDQATWGDDQIFRTLSDIDISQMCLGYYGLNFNSSSGPLSGSVRVLSYYNGSQRADQTAQIQPWSGCSDPNRCGTYVANSINSLQSFNYEDSYIVTANVCKTTDPNNCTTKTFLFSKGSTPDWCSDRPQSTVLVTPSVIALSSGQISQDDQSGSVKVDISSLNTQVEADQKEKTNNELQIVYGTRKDQYTSKDTLQLKQNKYQLKLKNLKSRTYHYKIIATDENGKQYTSQEYTLKHGNWFFRFWGDLWEKVKSVFKK